MSVGSSVRNSDFSNFGSLKSTETPGGFRLQCELIHFSNFGSLKSTETRDGFGVIRHEVEDFSNFGSLKSTETPARANGRNVHDLFQQFRLVEEH